MKKNATVKTKIKKKKKKKKPIPEWDPWERQGSFFPPASRKPEKLNQVKFPGLLGAAGLGRLNQDSRHLRGVTQGPSGE